MAVVPGTLNKYVFTYTVGSRTIYAANYEDAMAQLFNSSDGTNSNGLDLNKAVCGLGLCFQTGGVSTDGSSKVSNGAGRSGSVTGATLP